MQMSLIITTLCLCLILVQGWWCQASHGSCVGQGHYLQKDPNFEARVAASLKGYHFGGTLRLVDWDADGDVDVLASDAGSIWFHERLPGDVFRKHELLNLTEFTPKEGQSRFEVADWDGDQRLDLLLCTLAVDVVTVRWLGRSLLTSSVNSVSDIRVVLQTSGPACDIQAVDFDEDGDLDLLLGHRGIKIDPIIVGPDLGRPTSQRYFERVSNELEECIGEENPLAAFAGQVQWIADLDGDARLDVLVAHDITSRSVRWRYFRRTAAGSFVEPSENPLATISQMHTSSWGLYELFHVADWNSDGLPDVLRFEASLGGRRRGASRWKLADYFQHLVNTDLKYNSHVNTYMDIHVGEHLDGVDTFSVVDWNRDGFQDVVVMRSHEMSSFFVSRFLQLYEFDGKRMNEVEGVFDNVTFGGVLELTLNTNEFVTMIDWDKDGSLDLLLSIRDRLLFFEMISGSFREASENPFGNIRLNVWGGPNTKPMVVDWDNDGDLDLFLSPPDGRYFEHLENGSLFEWPLEQSPLSTLMKSLPPHAKPHQWPDFSQTEWEWHFVDCDTDGDFDLIYTQGSEMHICEHDGSTHEWRCDAAILCLGTNLSHFDRGPASRSVFVVSDGLLELFVQPTARSSGLQRWTPGFCVPSDPCHGLGACGRRQTHCGCLAGHEALDCSQCQPNYYSLPREVGQVQDCKACPGADGKVCHARGICFDDARAKAAKALENRSTGAWMAMGNGSCSCNEGDFYGKDEEGRSTCMDGNCPAGTEESDGSCSPCVGGFFSIVGGRCKACPAGKFSPKKSGSCSDCPAGSISRISASAVCEPCEAGSFAEKGSRTCTQCPQGKVSAARSGACEPCDAGRFAQDFQTCEQCPGGKFAGKGSNRCEDCPLGTVSSPGSAECSSCGRFLVRATADATQERCQPSVVDIGLGIICCITSACVGFLFLTSFFGRLPISDISLQGEKVVITTSIAHYFLKRAHPVVSFVGTGVPDLDKNEKNLIWKVTAMSLYQLTLHCSDKPDMALDTSIGHLHLRFPHVFLSTGMWHCPLILWCLFLATVIAAAASQVTWSLTSVTCTVGLVAGLLGFALRRRQGERTPLAKRRRQFFKEWRLNLALQQCDRGPDRSMTAGKLLEFLQFFDSFIKDRSMYYVSSNIVKPLTQPYQLSFAELVGPTKIQWFVSHYWGMPLRHFGDAVRKHASSYEAHWQDTAYWVCTFSNSQWHVKDELGNGKWQDSSFYHALKSPNCKGTTMAAADVAVATCHTAEVLWS
eukprot:s97_g22.t1